MLIRGRWTYNMMMMNRQPLPRVKKAGTPSTTDVVESPDMNRSGTLTASMVLTTRDHEPDYENIKAKLISTKRTSTRVLDIETRKTTANKIPLRFKEMQPCKLPAQFQVGIGV
ncbi:hypothetical protein MRX96_041302 [Rhipicephalus microplus]